MTTSAVEQVPGSVLDVGGGERVFVLVLGVVVLLLLSVVVVGCLLLRDLLAGRRPRWTGHTREPSPAASSGRRGATATLEQRLAELDDLRRRGVIDADEHRTARGRVLAGGA